MTTVSRKRKEVDISSRSDGEKCLRGSSFEYPVLVDIDDKDDTSPALEPEICALCFDPLKSSLRSSLLCIHTFHIDCIDQWLAKSFENLESDTEEHEDTIALPMCSTCLTCPTCRSEWISSIH
jgi:hypothetical protein